VRTIHSVEQSSVPSAYPDNFGVRAICDEQIAGRHPHKIVAEVLPQ